MSSQRQWTVLLVDDSEDDRFLFTYAFRTAGIPGHILESQDGDEAIEVLQRAHGSAAADTWPDVMFLDLKMPGRDGFEVLTWVKRTIPSRALEIYVLSGSNEPSDVQRARSLGADDYIAKPITEQKLQQLFRGWADRGPRN
jgi:CheY-like chemotaxis protein